MSYNTRRPDEASLVRQRLVDTHNPDADYPRGGWATASMRNKREFKRHGVEPESLDECKCPFQSSTPRSMEQRKAF